ncbi:hypothetical protein BDB01DRAFT_221807 [Pilobolus umbonatus]|nr:hypothetical protein BDB01DRAFT_221807 [Pilobolus umbonatus]
MEWKPLGLDIDFDAFNDIMEDGYFSVKDPVFSATEELVEPQHYELVSQSLEPVLKEELISHEEHNTEDDDTSSVEYAPPKEKDIPYIPDDEYIIDLSHFSANVDFTPYEIRSLEDDDKYSLLDDLNELKQMQCRLIDDHSIGKQGTYASTKY